MNRYHKQCICMVLSAVIFASAAGMIGMDRSVVAHAEEYKNTAKEDAIQDIVETVAGVKDVDDEGYDKEETVYIISDASGNPTELIASEWLKNFEGSPTIEDRSELKDIKNVKGYEDYKQGKDGSLTWNAGGNDIYYQGTPTEESPVLVHVTYKLDGKVVTPEEIKGKSGKVEIRFDYVNKTDETIEIDGETEHVSIPFTMLTGVILPNDHFNNVEVENARLISEGNNAIVIGYAFPGLYQSLKYDEFKANLDEEQREKAEDIEISDHVTIKADATDFELNSTLTVALPDVLKDISFTDNIDTDKVKDDMDELADATDELIDGTGELLDGVYELKDGTAEFKDGTSELKDGTRDLKDGTEDILSGSDELKDGARDMKDGACEAFGGTKKLYRGTRKLDNGAGDAYSGSKQLNNGVKQIASLLGSKSGDIATLNTLAQYLNSQNASTGTPHGQSAGGLGNSLMAMNAANERAMLSVRLLTDSVSGNTSENAVSDDEAEKKADTDKIRQSIDEAAETAETVTDALNTLSSVIKDKIDVLEEEKEGLAEELEELGDPDPQPDEADTESLSGDEAYDRSPDHYKAYYDEYYRDYYQKYYELSGRMDTVDAIIELLEGISEDIEPVSVSVDSIEEDLKEALEGMEALYPDDEEGEDDAPRQEEDIIEMVISANKVNSQAASAVWQVVDELEKMEVLDSGYTRMRYSSTGAPAGASMTPEQLIQMLMSITDTTARNNKMQELLQDPATQVQTAVVIASLDDNTRNALQMDNTTKTMLNKIVQSVVSNGVSSLANTLNSPSTKSSLAKLTAGAGSLMDGLHALYDGTGELKDGVYELRGGMRELSDGGVKLYDGTVDLHDGIKDLDDGAGDLDEGAADLDEGAGDLDDGVGELLDGAEELHDGMIEFNDEGIEKLIDLFGDNVTDMLDRLDAIQKTGAGYQTFSGKNDEMNGSVKFILKTDEIKGDY